MRLKALSIYLWTGPKHPSGRTSPKRKPESQQIFQARFPTTRHAPQAAILYDKFHVMKHLGEALDNTRKAEYARLKGKQHRFIKGQK